ncbi:hypothetical protein C3F00_045510, partial [Pseudomonas sp. MWU13-2860]
TDAPALQQLADFAHELGYELDRNGEHLTVQDISLLDALNINARFGGELLISCDLRRDPPARF